MNSLVLQPFSSLYQILSCFCGTHLFYIIFFSLGQVWNSIVPNMSCKNHENVAIVLFGLIIVTAPLVRTNLTVPLVYLTSVISENQFKVQDQHIHSALMIAVEEINKRHVLQNVTLVAVPKKIEVKEDVTLVIDKVLESNAGAVLIGGNICEDIVTASKTWNKFSISYVRAYLMSIAHRIILQILY